MQGPRMTREELEKKVKEFLEAEVKDPVVQRMLVSFQGD